MDRVLIICAHPDDEVLGCGGVIIKHTLSKDEVHCYILSEGVTSRYDEEWLETIQVADAKKRLKDEAKQAAIILGAEYHFADYPDQKLDTIPILDINKSIEKMVQKVNPTIVYTHCQNDDNLDHRIVYRACITACRSNMIKEIYAFEIQPNTKFQPNVFVDISETIDKKIQALQCYESESRQYPHPRSTAMVRVLTMYRGSQIGFPFAEAFELVRWIR